MLLATHQHSEPPVPLAGVEEYEGLYGCQTEQAALRDTHQRRMDQSAGWTYTAAITFPIKAAPSVLLRSKFIVAVARMLLPVSPEPGSKERGLD
jgi:hypothetical protein